MKRLITYFPHAIVATFSVIWLLTPGLRLLGLGFLVYSVGNILTEYHVELLEGVADAARGLLDRLNEEHNG